MCRILYLKYDLIQLKMCSQFNRCIQKKQKLNCSWNDVDRIYYLHLFRFGNWVIDVANCVVLQKESFTTYVGMHWHRRWLPPMHSEHRGARESLQWSQKRQTIIAKRFENYFYLPPLSAMHCAWSLSLGPLFALFWRKAWQSQRIDCQWANARVHNKWSKWK